MESNEQSRQTVCLYEDKQGKNAQDGVVCAVRMSMDNLGRVFLSFVKEVACQSETQAPTRSFHSTAALDPGVRTFQITYDADGVRIEWGE